jgi:sulfonate transport system ATP-binding protein
MAQALLELHVAAKSFGERRVLHEVDITVSCGEIVSLVGPSGCGKSTLLRIVAGLDRDYQGWARVEGQEVQLHLRSVGFVFQEPRLLPWLTVADNVGFEAGPGGGRDPRVAELLAEVGLADWAQAYPKQLSGGMAQRVAIARGLFTQPALLLLDEPFSAVDAFTRMRLQDTLLEVARRHGTTLLLVTHDVDEAAYLCDRVLVMGARPGVIRREVEVSLLRPRARNHPALAHKRADVLEALDDLRAPAALTKPVALEVGL